jgi:hypothetical protein
VIRHVHQVREESHLKIAVSNKKFVTRGPRRRRDDEIPGSHPFTVVYQLVLHPSHVQGDLFSNCHFSHYDQP